MKTRPLSTTLVLGLAAAVLLAAWPVRQAFAQSQDTTSRKIQLIGEALRARDAGDIAAAQRALMQLAAIAPNDATVLRLRNEIEAQAAAQAAARQSQVAEAERAAGQAAADVEAQRTAAAAAATAQAIELANARARAAETSATAAATSAPTMIEVRLPDSAQNTTTRTVGPTPEQEAEAAARVEAQRLNSLITSAQSQLNAARTQIRDGRPDDAIVTIDTAIGMLPNNPLMQKVIADLNREKASAYLEKAQRLLNRGDVEGARAALAIHAQLAPGSTRAGAVERQIARAETKPVVVTKPGVDPAFAAQRADIAQMIAKGRAQYLAGDVDGAQATFRGIEAQEPDNTVAKGFLLRIANEKSETGALNREKTRAQLLEEVAKGWQRPGIYEERPRETSPTAAIAPLAKKLNEIVLPTVSFTRAEIGQVVTALSAASEEFDLGAAPGTPKGVNVVLLDPSNKNPAVTIALRNATLKRVLDFVTESVGYQYEVQADAVIVRPGGETNNLETQFFPITRATVLRMSGMSGGGGAAGGGANPYSSSGANAESGASGGEAASMKAFLSQAGVSFTVDGASLAYDGSAIIVTQTPRNIERIRNILARYNDVRQVEIESKFMEVQEGALEELGVQWALSRRGVPQINPTTGAPILDSNGRQVFVPQEVYGTNTLNRSLAGAFNVINSVSGINIVGGTTTQTTTNNGIPTTTSTSALSQTVPMNAPVVPGGVSIGVGTTPLANISGFVGEFDVNAIVRALSQKQGTDLLSSPKVTVVSGTPANITVAQELRYPQSYGEIQSQVSAGTGGASVTITAGTPQEFTARNVGVEMKVTPTVEEDGYSISLDLNPKVTEFEGFVEYGGPSVAISSGTSVTVPPGFYQPIFSVREVTTKVTIWDGATLVMGGLTREEVKKVNDKVPFFGDIPLVGRLFRSKGESSQKRNLLIFVTANLVSPGGSPKNQSLKSTPANSLFQNPTIVTPASAEPRTRGNGK